MQHLCSNTSCPLYASAHVCFSIQLISNLIKNLTVKKKEINSSKIQVFKRCTKTWAPPNLIYSQRCTLLIKQSTHKKHRTEGSSSARYSKTRAMPLTSNIVLHSTHFKSWKKQLVPQNALCPLKTPHFLSSHYFSFHPQTQQSWWSKAALQPHADSHLLKQQLFLDEGYENTTLG